MSGTHAINLPATLGPDFTARLRELLCAAAGPDGGSGAGALQAVLGDPAVHAVLIALPLRGEPAASLVQVLKDSDPLAAWRGLGCI